MSERPILFSGPMVRAILEGRKTQTRRVVAPSPGKQREWLTPESIASVPHGAIINGGWQMHHPRAGTRFAGVDVAHDSPFGWIKCPYGAPGDTLWVRETFFEEYDPNTCRPYDPPRYHYRATYEGEEPYLMDGDGYLEVTKRGEFRSPWRPSIHMPRDASRLSLRIKSVRVERLQEISQGDAQAEGLSGPMIDAELDAIVNQIGLAPSKAFRALWESINAKSHPWASNPWVWVVEFERVAQEAPRE